MHTSESRLGWMWARDGAPEEYPVPCWDIDGRESRVFPSEEFKMGSGTGIFLEHGALWGKMGEDPWAGGLVRTVGT